MGSSVRTLPYWLNNKKSKQTNPNKKAYLAAKYSALLPLCVREPRQGKLLAGQPNREWDGEGGCRVHWGPPQWRGTGGGVCGKMGWGGEGSVAAVAQGVRLARVGAGRYGPRRRCRAGQGGRVCAPTGCAVTLPWHHQRWGRCCWKDLGKGRVCWLKHDGVSHPKAQGIGALAKLQPRSLPQFPHLQVGLAPLRCFLTNRWPRA